MIFVSATPGPYEDEHACKIVEQVVRPTGLLDTEVEIRPVLSQVDDLLSEINQRVEKNERVLITTLTKRMAEDLTEYFDEYGIKVRYLHSDVHTVERVEIIRDLRFGKFDVLVGINLLREGLDLPEVALVAILDADKEGFLRSETSLIQTMGRAARNVRGRVILYADQLTGSMKRAIRETNRRRIKQIEYNKIHHITPQSIKKAIKSIIDHEIRPEPVKEYFELQDIEDIPAYIKLKTEEMKQAAKNLEFEKAALIRDEIKVLVKISKPKV